MNSGVPFLSRLSLFADVSSDTLARLEHRMRRREFAPRAVIDAGSGIEFLLAKCGIIEQSDFDQLLAEHPAAVRAMMAAPSDRLGGKGVRGRVMSVDI